ncbi:hypothetical protein SPFL3102_03576 [Sporomusaceae bacterium FL31]|nr:hypothetical protein SPFL3101_00429 [Sporomusaceae bacterium FL31]GCE35725.1 hypothetical protein SPFL3102_03576 [Sporomusaceae bacterium]
MGLGGAILGGVLGKKALKTPNVPEAQTPAQPAAEAAPPPESPQTADSVNAILRKKAKGKQSLTVPISSSSSGTGLSI